MFQPLYSRERTPVPFKYEDELGPEPVWTFYRRIKISFPYRDSNAGPSSPWPSRRTDYATLASAPWKGNRLVQMGLASLRRTTRLLPWALTATALYCRHCWLWNWEQLKRGEKSMVPVTLHNVPHGKPMQDCLGQGLQTYGTRHSLLYRLFFLRGYAVAQSVEALRYKSEGRGFNSRWCHWNISLT